MTPALCSYSVVARQMMPSRAELHSLLHLDINTRHRQGVGDNICVRAEQYTDISSYQQSGKCFQLPSVLSISQKPTTKEGFALLGNR